MSEPAQNQLKLVRFTHQADKNMLGEFHNGARAVRGAPLCASAQLRRRISWRLLRPSPALRRLLRAIAVAAPRRRQERAIAEPQRRETDRAPPLTDAGTARREQYAALPRAR